MEKEKGVVKWFNDLKGYGFIAREGQEDVFVHQKAIKTTNANGRRTLRDGDHVMFTVVKGEKGFQAEDVTVIDS